MTTVTKAACIGAGVIGSAWAARLAWNGIDVKVLDPHPEAEKRLNEVIENADRAQAKLTMAPRGRKGTVKVVRDLAEAVHDADFIQESAPEREDLKIKLLADVDASCRPDIIIGSSTSGLLPTKLQSRMKHPERFLVGHPFNPVYLMPLVEVVGGEKTTKINIDRAMAFYREIGMQPLHVRKEVDAFIADRLMEALWREALWLVNDGVATVEEIDDAVRFGPGLRWSFMGTFLVYRIAGGVEGMRHFMAQFGPALKWPWTKLMDVPELTDALVDKIAAQSDDQAKGMSIRELERKRDDCLIAVFQALKGQDWGAGKTLADYERRLIDKSQPAASDTKVDLTKPLRLLDMTIPADWTDYNGHLNDSRYHEVFTRGSDGIMTLIGAGQDYISAGRSLYTAETHVCYKREVSAFAPIYVTTQLLGHDRKRIHFFMSMQHAQSDEVLATCEQVMLNVDTTAKKVVEFPPEVMVKLAELQKAQDGIPRPKEVGRSVALRKS
jgi:carnitine 3-dehydrogenase